jgi:histone acetyltransferase (RNA polymerase elongator complex component)
MKPLIVPFFIAHQGCPHQCVFCDQVKISGGAEAVPTPDELYAAFAAYRETSGGRPLEAAFFGGTFTNLPRDLQASLLGALQPLLASGELAAIRISTRPDAVDSRTVSFLRRMGVGTVELGIQSLDDVVLERSGRGHTARVAEDACRLLAASGFRVGAQLMPGLPGDSPVTALATLRRTLDLRPDFLRIYPVLVVAGTELERLYRSGGYVPLELDAAVKICKIMLLETLRASVPVIRIGLHGSGELQANGSVVAGPCHPSFRQLVESSLCYDLMASLASSLPPAQPVTIHAAPTRLSDVAGQRRANLLRLRTEVGREVAAIKSDPRLSRLELRLTAGDSERTGTMLNLNYAVEEVADVV